MRAELILVGVVVMLPLWLSILRSWQRGIWLLLVYAPFSGLPILLSNHSVPSLLFKDIAFVLPAYISFYCFVKKERNFRGIPGIFFLLLFFLFVLVFVQMFNPRGPGFMGGLVGAKVWLFYMPLTMMSYAMCSSLAELVRLLRPLVVLSIIPAAFGIVEWLCCRLFGYERTMETIYGAAAKNATQQFATFSYGADFYRIPSTFSFVSQYTCYLWIALLSAYILSELDPKMKGRVMARGVTGLMVLASFLSGSRGNFLFIPLICGVTFSLNQGFRGGFKVFLLLALMWIPVSTISGLNLFRVFSEVSDLSANYAREIGYEQLVNAIESSPLGWGTGANTNQARYVTDRLLATADSSPGLENYYGKAFIELGIPGGITIVGLLLVVFLTGLSVYRRAHNRGVRAASSALLVLFALIIAQSSKALWLDIDPMNLYYWIYAGVMFRLNDLVKTEENERMATRVS